MGKPLVSIGIPTYNRPNGLKQVLECFVNQTYPNLQIIVSNNASTVPGYAEVMSEYLGKDLRIQYFCQEQNIGGWLNFKFVFEKAVGEFFMWAADDDEWHPEFVNHCLENIGTNGTVMTQVEIGAKGNRRPVASPALSAENTKYGNALLFIDLLMPHIFYGLHRRSSIDWFESFRGGFDYFDCYFGLRQILGPGALVTNATYFFSSVLDTGHKTIPFSPRLMSRFSYLPWTINSLRLVYGTKDFCWKQKLNVTLHFVRTAISCYIYNEQLPWCKAARVLLRLRRWTLDNFFARKRT